MPFVHGCLGGAGGAVQDAGHGPGTTPRGSRVYPWLSRRTGRGKAGLEHVAFVEVRLSDTREAALQAFNTAIREPEVEACRSRGRLDYLVKVRTSNVRDYRRCGGKISQLPHIASTSTYCRWRACWAGRLLTLPLSAPDPCHRQRYQRFHPNILLILKAFCGIGNKELTHIRRHALLGTLV